MPNPIPDPLWSLMLATNGCHPGCGCEDDRYDMSPLAVANWISTVNPQEPRRALEQTRDLIDDFGKGRLTRQSLIEQASFYVRDDATAMKWLQCWERIINAALDHDRSDFGDRADLAERFTRKGKRRH